MESLAIGQRVYYQHSQRGWSLGKLMNLNLQERRADILDDETGNTEKVINGLNLIHGYQENSYDPNDPELFRVADLHVSTVLHCVKARCEQLRLQYSRMGEMILSINPFQPMPFNSDQERVKYLEAADPAALPPHVWQIAHKAFTQIIVRNQGNQSVVISGESGSGKTENTKMLINYLGQMSFKHSCNAAQRQIADRVSDRLKWSNPILESFGNARTVRNDNSSRFGKYTKLFFDPLSGVMIGGEMVTYLLEKSRIISIAKGERNYHVFYEMLAGLSPQEKLQLGGLKDARDYRCLNRGETLTRRGVDGRDVNDAQEFKTLMQAFAEMGLKKEESWGIIKTLAAILHLQDMTFGSDGNDKATIANARPMQVACELLAISCDELKPCFLEKSKTKILTLLASKSEAEGLRDAFCKALYVGLFDSLVAIVNSAIRPSAQESAAGGGRYIGVLDIFGFENFQKNSFEQMCINFANETLQNHYNKYTFLNDEEECRQEGIECPKVTFPNNLPCLEMFDLPKTGIFALLDEQCSVKTGTSQAYTTNAWDNWTGKNDYFVRPKSTVPNEFGIRHYASFVSYNTEEWLEKNADALKEEAKRAVQNSEDMFIRRLLDGIEAVSSDGQMKKRVTVASRFQGQLRSLRGELESTETHFIRCVKPNMQAVAAVMDNMYVGAQLESAGVLQTIALKRQGYPVRRSLQAFSSFFFLIAPRKAQRLHQQKYYTESSKSILDYYHGFYRWGRPNFAVGKSKVFLRANIWSTLEKLLIRRRRYLMRRVVPYLKGWVASFRKRKAEEERRRQEQQRLLQEQARAREKQTGSGINYRDTAVRSGLNETKAQWFEELAMVFRNFDLPILLDVIYNLPTRDHAHRALTEMQNDRLQEALPAALRRLFEEIQVRPSVVEAMAAKGYVSLAIISQLSDNQLRDVGMNSAEMAGLNRLMLSQQSAVVVNERLRETLGQQGSIDRLLQDVRSASTLPRTSSALRRAQSQQQQPQQAVQPPSGGPASPTSAGGDQEAKIKRLMDMGFSRDQSVDALGKCRGNVQHAGEFLLASSPLANRRPSGIPQPLPGTATAGANHTVVMPPRIVPPPTRPGSQGGGTVTGVVIGPPTAVASPNRTTPVAATASLPPVAGAAPPPIDAAKVDQIVAMGFDRASATNALIAAKGDVGRAINRLLR